MPLVAATLPSTSGTSSLLLTSLGADFWRSTQPEWMWVTPGQVKFTKGENVGVSNWAYEQGTSRKCSCRFLLCLILFFAVRDPTLQQVATYYKNLLSWYTKVRKIFTLSYPSLSAAFTYLLCRAASLMRLA
jgi:hypothetical protein